MVLKSPVHVARVKLLLAMFPDAKFVYGHRHPLEVSSTLVAKVGQNDRMQTNAYPKNYATLAWQTVGDNTAGPCSR